MKSRLRINSRSLEGRIPLPARQCCCLRLSPSLFLSHSLSFACESVVSNTSWSQQSRPPTFCASFDCSGIDFSKTDLFVGLSFDTISATGANGAVIHYKPEKETCATIDPKKIYLCDSGAQFRYFPLPFAKYFTFPHLNPVLFACPLPSRHIIPFPLSIQIPASSRYCMLTYFLQRRHNRHNPHNNLLSPYPRRIPRLHPRLERSYCYRPVYLPEIDHRIPN